MIQTTPIDLPFMKMHGLGNDFVVLDMRKKGIVLEKDFIKSIADRHRGVGFDQLAIIRADIKGTNLEFYNADGSTSKACGNATRCIARYLMKQSGRRTIFLTTDHGTIEAQDAGQGLTSVNMGPPAFSWRDIPLAESVETLSLPIPGAPVATNMGNPHCTFFVKDAEAIDLEREAAPIEHHSLFPDRTNVQFVSVIGKNHLRMRVWERGVGVTLASGSSSCATVVASCRRGITGKSVQIELDGGTMHVEWCDAGVWLTGPTMHVFSGSLTSEFMDETK